MEELPVRKCWLEMGGLSAKIFHIVLPGTCGRVAQLGERIVRNDEVAGSIPVSSTKFSSRSDNSTLRSLTNLNHPLHHIDRSGDIDRRRERATGEILRTAAFAGKLRENFFEQRAHVVRDLRVLCEDHIAGHFVGQ